MTDLLDDDGPSWRGRGGGGSGGGGFYHLSFRSGSRARGACARSAYCYLARELEYELAERDPELDRAVYVESGHLPDWAEDARQYWEAADWYERANGRLFIAADFALPRGFELEEQIELAREVVRDLTDAEQLPYTFAIHAGEDRDRREHNPHVHVMFSERSIDGIERTREDWFGRANREYPERGGAPKSRTFHGREWVERARERLADRINERLRERGRRERVDHRSYERQGLDRQPGEHFGPHAAHVLERTGEHDRLERVAEIDRLPERLLDLEIEIQHLELTRSRLLMEQRALERDRERERDRDRERELDRERERDREVGGRSRSDTLERDYSRER